jgi:iron complex transport system substrate-binding protein
VFFGCFVVVFVIFVVSLAAQPRRIVSLVPAVTEMLFAVGAGPQVAAVSSYDAYPPEVKGLPRVGALLDPDVERILSLKPDLVVTYGSQTDLRAQLTRAAIPVFDYRHAGLADITSTMRALGVRTGHGGEAERAAAGIEARLAAVRGRVAGRARPRTLLVFGREPRTLRNIYASGGRGFLHDMLEAAGGVNVFADVDRESVQATTELILTRAPDVILELRSAEVDSADDVVRDIQVWQALPAVPAVRHNRVVVLRGQDLTVPGPRVAAQVERMATALHPDR